MEPHQTVHLPKEGHHRAHCRHQSHARSLIVPDTPVVDLAYTHAQSFMPSVKSHDQKSSHSRYCGGGAPSPHRLQHGDFRVNAPAPPVPSTSQKQSPWCSPIFPTVPFTAGPQCTPSPTSPSSIASLALKSSQSIQSSCSSVTSIVSDPPPYSSQPEDSNCPPAPCLRSRPSFSDSQSIDEDVLFPFDCENKDSPPNDHAQLMLFPGLPVTPITNHYYTLEGKKSHLDPYPRSRSSEFSELVSDMIGTGSIPVCRDTDPDHAAKAPTLPNCPEDHDPIWEWLDGLTMDAAVDVGIIKQPLAGNKRECGESATFPYDGIPERRGKRVCL